MPNQTGATGKDIVAPPLSNTEGTLDYKWYTWFNSIYNRLKKGPFKIDGYTVATAPPATDNAANAGQALYTNIIYVTNEVGGSTLAFSDGTNWRRVQDRAIIA
jgi:hypothetical protein